jgi:hypothetical protein
MKKVIRLTESDLMRIVKRTISELDRSTYDKASEIANKKGYTKLADKFASHGKEFGLNQDKDIISIVVKKQDEKTHRVRILKLEGYSQGEFEMTTEDVDTGDTKVFDINKYSNNIEFFLRQYKDGLEQLNPALPETRKDARKILKQFENIGVNVTDIDPRKISYEDSDFKNQL